MSRYLIQLGRVNPAQTGAVVPLNIGCLDVTTVCWSKDWFVWSAQSSLISFDFTGLYFSGK